MLSQPVALHDITDVEGFVQATLNASGIQFTPDERDDLVCEGLAILYQLADRFDGRGRFSGFAAMFLPRKLGNAWHQAHEEHRYITQPDGKRSWQYHKRTVSLDAMRAERAGTRDGNGNCQGDRVDAKVLGSTKWVPVAVAPLAEAA